MKNTFWVALIGAVVIDASLALFGHVSVQAQAVPHILFLMLLAYFTVYIARLRVVALKYFGIVSWFAMVVMLVCMVLGGSPAGDFFRGFAGLSYTLLLLASAAVVERVRRTVLSRLSYQREGY